MKAILKKVITMFLFFSFMSATMGMLYGPPDEWCIKGPGGLYGVVSIHTEWSWVFLGPFKFTTNYGFETTRLIYFEIIPIVIIGTIIGVALYRRRRKRSQTSTIVKRYRGWARRNLDFILLGSIMVIGIAVCIWLPVVINWHQQIVDEKLCLAIINNDLDKVKKYVSGNNINCSLIVNEEPMGVRYPPPLLLAALKGNIDLVRFFLDNGADINKKTASDRESVLHLVLYAPRNKSAIVKYLINKGVDINAVNLWQRTALFSAVEDKPEVDVITLLLENGANPNILDNGKRAALDVAKSNQIKDLLKKYGAKTGREISSPTGVSK